MHFKKHTAFAPESYSKNCGPRRALQQDYPYQPCSSQRASDAYPIRKSKPPPLPIITTRFYLTEEQTFCDVCGLCLGRLLRDTRELAAVMERGVCMITVVVLILRDVAGFSIRNEQLGRCMEVLGGRLAMEECRPGSDPQQWEWRAQTQALVSLQTGECLSVDQAQEYEIVHLRACRAGEGQGEGQAWGCSKKGHLALSGTKGLHLGAHRDAAKVFLSRDRGRGSKWSTLGNRTICDEPGGPHHWHRHGDKPTTAPSAISASAGDNTGLQQNAMAAPNLTETSPEKKLHPPPYSTTGPGLGPSPTPFFSLEYGLGWKVTMLVLSSLALVLGLVILLLNIYHNRKKKVVCVVKSYTPTGAASQQGSPVPNERAPLTRHPMGPPRSPSLQRGEILIEWKDGTVTPLFDTNYLTD
ncbi:hypothetical protein SKAU_G00122960 [Synaphobranchus kaupii]|uniref:Ricin B lectin domain-containing protein n=1 Tax=Synaphobranchus kaupii TaxID=118154 RepID=A0A9Q1FPJ4_SYNKA|nr:hypothetical protein SKAU_G00122960 [Synaphobranchus kaupii]